MPEPLLIGIDGGGTQCRARLCDASGRLLGEGAGGPANVRLDPREVMHSIMNASRQAAAAAGLRATDLEHAHAGFGLAGAALKSACDALLAEPHPFASVALETDAYAAWLGAHRGADGAILILGTGSCGFAVVGGEQFYVSGLGAEVSDEASGYMIGREAIRGAVWAHDGRGSMTPMAEAILAHFDRNTETIIAFAHQARPADYARFAKLVFEYAARRDPLALALVTAAATDAVRIITRLLDVGAPSVCLFGGVTEPLAPWLPPPIRERISLPKGDALDGAILMAKRALSASKSASARA
jgi:glucosamine kinase